jgi:hypothetical protein
LKKGDKALVGNKGYRRFVTKPDDGHFAIDQAKAEEDAKFDGVFVLRSYWSRTTGTRIRRASLYAAFPAEEARRLAKPFRVALHAQTRKLARHGRIRTRDPDQSMPQ